MPTAMIKKYAEEAKVSIEKAEECWEKAKEIADATVLKGDKKKEKDGKYWAAVNFQTRRCLHLPLYGKDHTEKSKSKK